MTSPMRQGSKGWEREAQPRSTRSFLGVSAPSVSTRPASGGAGLGQSPPLAWGSSRLSICISAGSCSLKDFSLVLALSPPVSLASLIFTSLFSTAVFLSEYKQAANTFHLQQRDSLPWSPRLSRLSPAVIGFPCWF